MLEVIVLWDIAGTPVGAAATRDIFVNHPITQADNDVAALLLNPEVGRWLESRRAWAFKGGVERIKHAASISKSHPAARAVSEVGGARGAACAGREIVTREREDRDSSKGQERASLKVSIVNLPGSPCRRRRRRHSPLRRRRALALIQWLG